MNQPNPTQLRLQVLLQKGISEPAALYIIDLERRDTQAIASSLAELSRMPAWAGKTIKLALSGRSMTFTGSCWVLD